MTLRSMTGFGRAERATPEGRFTAEARSVNSRFLDVNLRLPQGLASIEPALRERTAAKIARGKIDLVIRWEPAPALAPSPKIAVEVLEDLIRQTRAIRALVPELRRMDLASLLRIPGVILDQSADERTPETAAALAADVRETAEAALDALGEARAREGAALADALGRHLATVRESLAAIDAGKLAVVERYRDRLRQRIAELLKGSDTTVDPGRIEMEAALFADRADIQEEIDRLRAHLDTFDKTILHPEGPAGRSLDFLVQEILREANTIGSKARDLDLARHVLAMKNAIESIKEQVMNVE